MTDTLRIYRSVTQPNEQKISKKIQEVMKDKRGGARKNAGRKKIHDRDYTLSVYVSKQALDNLNRLTDNKSEFIDNYLRKLNEEALS